MSDETDILHEQKEDREAVDVGIIDYLQIVVLLVLPSFIFSTSWMVQEEWMTNIIKSAAFMFGALILSTIWILKIVFPFLRPITRRKVMSWSRHLRLFFGLGVPVLIIGQVILSFWFFQRSWVGNLIMIGFIIYVMYLLHRQSFFKQEEGDVKQ